MRTFHTGGVASGVDITSGLPRVEELFEARVPKGLRRSSAEIDGIAEVLRDGDSARVRVKSTELYSDEYDVPKGAKLLVKKDDMVEQGAILARLPQLASGKPEPEPEAPKKPRPRRRRRRRRSRRPPKSSRATSSPASAAASSSGQGPHLHRLRRARRARVPRCPRRRGCASRTATRCRRASS